MIKIDIRLIDITDIENNEKIENVEYSESITRNTKGLMFQNTGRLLMRFIKEGKFSIWMPFMRFSLDLIFIDKNKRITDIRYNIQPIDIFKPKTWSIYRPKEKSLYVLEIESGLSKEKNLSIGDKLNF